MSVFTRLAEFEGKIYLDLGAEDWRAVEIAPDGWRVVNDYPVRFRRASSMLGLPVPELGLAPAELKEKLAGIVNISEDSWILVLSWLTYCYVCLEAPHPILILHGEQGSGKSFTSRALKSLIDPSKAPLRQEPKELRDLAIACDLHWLLAFDNFSHISNILSDALCRIATGGGFAARTLYQNDEETVFQFLRPLLINGIDSLATRPDLLERSILITLPTIAEESRGKEAELIEAFEALKPQLLGALLSAVSQGLAKLPTVHPDKLPRMADFACWAIAVEEALGFEAGSFMEAYGDNRATAHETALEASPVGQAILRFMEHRSFWQGTATDLLVELERLVDERTSKSKYWAGTAKSLGKALTRLAPELRAFGIDVTSEKGSGGKRIIKIIKKDKGGEETPQTPQMPQDSPEPPTDKASSKWHESGMKDDTCGMKTPQSQETPQMPQNATETPQTQTQFQQGFQPESGNSGVCGMKKPTLSGNDKKQVFSNGDFKSGDRVLVTSNNKQRSRGIGLIHVYDSEDAAYLVRWEDYEGWFKPKYIQPAAR